MSIGMLGSMSYKGVQNGKARDRNFRLVYDLRKPVGLVIKDMHHDFDLMKTGHSHNDLCPISKSLWYNGHTGQKIVTDLTFEQELFSMNYSHVNRIGAKKELGIFYSAADGLNILALSMSPSAPGDAPYILTMWHVNFDAQSTRYSFQCNWDGDMRGVDLKPKPVVYDGDPGGLKCMAICGHNSGKGMRFSLYVIPGLFDFLSKFEEKMPFLYLRQIESTKSIDRLLAKPF